MSLRDRIYKEIHVDTSTQQRLSWFNRTVVFCIFFGALLTIISTEPDLWVEHAYAISSINFVLAGFFTIEYILRAWVAGTNPEYAGIKGRIRYLLTWPAIFDFLAILPTLLIFSDLNGYVLRAIRLLRILRFAKLGRYSRTLQYFHMALKSHGAELLFTLFVAAVALLFASTTLYIIEGPIQPEAFGSIGRASWWAINCLLSVGYGDAIPITPLGKVAAGFIALLGMATVALPAGIFAAAFSEAFKAKAKGGEIVNGKL